MRRELVRNAQILVEISEIQTETNTPTLLSESVSTSQEEDDEDNDKQVDRDSQHLAKFVHFFQYHVRYITTFINTTVFEFEQRSRS
jgi:uncharacterized membrane protein